MNLLEIDGSFGEGGGQILRSATTLACITQTPIRVKNIRSNRKVPGLRPSHLAAIKILAKMCNAQVDGLAVGSTSVEFRPNRVDDVFLEEDVGTAGSIPLIMQAVMPLALAGKKLRVSIRGGTDVPWSPTTNYTKYVLAEAYSRVGLEFTMKIQRRGYYPRGGGLVHLTVNPCTELSPVNLTKRAEKKANLVCCYTDEDSISDSIGGAKDLLESNGFATSIEKSQEKADNPGASMLVFSHDSSSITGADELLDLKNRSDFGKRCARDFADSCMGVDANLSDMLVTPLSLCKELSIFTVPSISKHLETNLYITSKLTGCKYGIGKIDGGYEVRLQGSSDSRVK